MLRYNLGLLPEKPRFDRFSYIEKAEYWALIWGIVMGGTGMILWFDNTSWLSLKLGFDIAQSVHYYEAWLATLAIIVWHFYFVIFNPGVYPMNLAWLTGQVSEREMTRTIPSSSSGSSRGRALPQSAAAGNRTSVRSPETLTAGPPAFGGHRLP